MYYVPHTPRQAGGSPTPPGSIFADLDFDSLYFSDNFSVNNFSFDFSSSLNSPLSDPFIPSLSHYITDPLPSPPQASREPIFKTNPIQQVYSLHQYEPRLTVPENSSDVASSHETSILEPQQCQQVLEPKSTIKAKRKEITGEEHSNSPESTDSLDSNSSRDPQKRKLEDMMQTFSTVPDIPNNQAFEKKRKNYDPKTRKKVALIRKFKPCKRCGIHRIACDLDGACEGCLKYALGNLSLAERFCHRRTLSELRFDGGFDWLYMKFNSTFIKKEIRGYRGPEMKMSIELDHLEVGEGHKLPLSIKVQEYLTDETEPLYNIEAMRNKSPEISIYDSTTTYFFEADSPRYAITPDSLPTVEAMVDWAKVELATAYGDPALRFAHSMAEFMTLYCQQEPKLPLVTLLGSCIKLISLVHCWRCRKIVSTSSANNTQNLLSIAACSQLLLIIKEGIREAEIEILEGLEPHLYGSRGPGQKNAIPLWACLWSLILMYRDRMAAYNQYMPQTLAAYSEAFELMSATKHLYDIITAHYALLFNPSTPLHLDCKPDDNFELLGRSEGLRNAFDIARNEAFNFYNAHTHFIDQDKHLRQDIIAKEQNFVQRL